MLSRFFVDRPIFATVISIVIVLVGLVALVRLPISQYPEVVPPTISVTATYPGASATVVADTVATPIEQEVNGVEDMIYMSSRSTNDGQMTLDVTFKLGTDLDMAQVLVQNRVAIAESKLPEEVRRQGITTKKRSPNILLAINFISDKVQDPSTGQESYRYDQLYLSNFATTRVKDALARIEGVGDVMFLGPRDYSMRIWLDPEKLASRNMTATDVLSAVSEQNIQVAAGSLGRPPTPSGQELQLTLNTLGRLESPEQFRNMIVKTGADGRVTYLRDVVSDDRPDQQGVELGAKNYDVNSYLDGEPSITIGIFQLPGSNALATAEAIKAKMEELRPSFARGVDYRIVYDTTVFIEESVNEVYKTLFEAFVLVFVVVLVFLQDWRATLLPMIDVPVSLIGTLAVMALLGFSLNNLSLFGLVLAIGIVVDDAIVVVENIERWMAKGLPPREATIKAMDEITGPVIAITLVLCSVFIPVAFLAGVTGQFYRQFALTIASATIISAINALTMAPARAVALIKPHGGEHGHQGEREALPRLGVAGLFGLAAAHWLAPLVVSALGREGETLWVWGLRLLAFVVVGAVGWFLARPVNRILVTAFTAFNKAFDWISAGYGLGVRAILRTGVLMLLVYAGFLGLTYYSFITVPIGFIPDQDKGYLVVNAQLPDGASLERTEAVARQLDEWARKTPGVAHTLCIPGYSIVTGVNLSNAMGMFVVLEPFHHRLAPDHSANAIAMSLRKQYSKVQEAAVNVFGAPPVDGLGSTGGFKLYVRDIGAAGMPALDNALRGLSEEALGQPGIVGVFSSFSINQPQLYVEVDRVKVKKQGVALSEVFSTLQAYLGSAYVNDVTLFNRNWQVNVQADAKFRLQPEQVGQLKVRNAAGQMVPLGALISIRDVTGPPIVMRYNLAPAADFNGISAPGVSSGAVISMIDQLAARVLPESMNIDWTDLTFQQIEASKDVLTRLIFPLAVTFVFMVLAGQYESWSLPLAVILIVPMCLLSALAGVAFMGMDNNIFTQIGLVVLVGLASKNAILIVEFAKQRQAESGLTAAEAAIEASQVRLRPIIMTSLAFILGVLPLVRAVGAGAEMRTALGVAVFSGMLGVTAFGLLFTPTFYTLLRRNVKVKPAEKPAEPHA